jgi:hypothetical protein
MLKFKLIGPMAFTALLSTLSVAHAGLIDQSTTQSAEYTQVYANGTAVGVTVEGAGVNQVVTMYVSNYTYGVGSSYWKGVIPNADVVVTGINSISVTVPDTCDSANTTSTAYGSDYCFGVNATFTKNDYLWKTNGVSQYTYGDLIYTIIGGIETYSATSTGTVTHSAGTIDISSTRAYLGKYTDVTVSVSTAN